MKNTHLDYLGVGHGLERHSVDLDQDVALLQVRAAAPVQDLLHLLAVSGVGDREAEPRVSLGDGDGQEPRLRRRPRNALCRGEIRG